MKPLDSASKMMIPTNVYARSFGSEMVLLNFRLGEYFGLDDVGAEIWRGLENGLPLGEIAVKIATQFDVSASDALTDIASLVSELRELSLLTDA